MVTIAYSEDVDEHGKWQKYEVVEQNEPHFLLNGASDEFILACFVSIDGVDGFANDIR